MTPEAGWHERLQRAWMSRGFLAAALLPASLVFAGAAGLKRSAYRLGLLRSITVSAPVVVVGNLIAGGAGKTPVVIALVTRLRAQGYTPGVVARGYGVRIAGVVELTSASKATDGGDEPLLIHLRTGAPVVVGPDRVAAARSLLVAHPEIDMIVSDDGLQHLRMARSAQVIVFDDRGVGNGWMLPAGPLRERPSPAAPARSLVVYNAQAASTPWPGTLAMRALTGATALADWWQGAPPQMTVLNALRGRRVTAAAGLARPQRFFQMLHDLGLDIAPLPLPDHHRFETPPWPVDTADVIVTEKDAVKLDPTSTGTTRVWVATLDLRLDAAFYIALLSLLPPPGMPHGNSIA